MKLFMLCFLALVAVSSLRVARADFVSCERFAGAACGDLADADAAACLAANAAPDGSCGTSGTMTAGALSNGDADPEFWLTTRFWRQYGRLKVIFSNCNSITARVSVATASGTTPAFIALHADNHLVAFARDGEPDASVSETFELSADGEVDLSLIGYRRVADDDFATEVPSYGVAIKCDNQASFTSLLHAQTGSHWQWVDASEPRECTRADTSVVMNYAVGSGDSWQRTGAMVEVSTAECVSPRAAIADARLDAAKRAIFTRPASENWSALPYDSTNERIAARLLIAGRVLRFGSACVRVGGTSSSTGLDTLKAESCTPSGASLSLVYRTVSGGATIDYPVESPVDDSSSPTPYPIDRVYQTPGEGHYTTLLGVGPNGAGDKYQGHCVRMVASPWAFAENGLNKGTPQHWGARNVIGSTKSLSYAGAEPTVHASLLGTDYVQINAGGTSADTYVCPLAEQAQVLLHKVVTVCDSDQDCYCKTTGDPHHFSYDGLKEDYMAVGYHRITGAGSRFELNTFQDSMTTEGRVSFNRLLYLKVDGEDVFSTQVHREDHDWCLTFWAGSQKTGGNPVVLFDGGVSPPGVPQGEDGVLQPEQPPTTWRMGESVEVGVAMTANHGGGWSYRLCKKTGSLDDISEACFQRTPLRFASDSQWLQFSPAIVPGAPRVRIPLTKLTENTSPPGSEWARNPVPACNFCSQAACGPPTMQPNYTAPSGKFPWGDREVEYYGGSEWIKWIRCGVVCAGEDPHQTFVNETGEHRPPSGLLCNGATQFAEPYPGVSGFVTNSTYPERAITAFSVVDELFVPDDIDEGDYILSWRWDCEQSPQVWQNCADIRIVAADSDSPTNLSPINIIAV